MEMTPRQQRFVDE
jgi:phage terminase small subunit